MREVGLEAITNRVVRVMIIIRTGGGKSLFFMVLAASSREGVSIVVVPLTLLREDLRDRCSKVGIRYAEWDGSSPPFWVNIVLVTPGSAVTKVFSRFINQKKMMRQLDRIVIDEYYMVLESIDKWRLQMKQLVEMGEKGTQVVYLIATLPLAEEGRFLQSIGMRREEVQILRDLTTRPNIQYSVVEFEREEEGQRAL
jgi:superfamily II DNA helicase RecQ